MAADSDAILIARKSFSVKSLILKENIEYIILNHFLLFYAANHNYFRQFD